MLNIFKNFSKFFSSTTIENNTEKIYNREEENSVSFIIDKDNNPIIQINVQNFENKHVIKFAELLFMINNGQYQKSILDILTEIAVKDPDRASFLGSVIKTWSTYIDKYIDLDMNSNYTKDKPCISPLAFSKIVLQQPGDNQNEK